MSARCRSSISSRAAARSPRCVTHGGANSVMEACAARRADARRADLQRPAAQRAFVERARRAASRSTSRPADDAALAPRSCALVADDRRSARARERSPRELRTRDGCRGAADSRSSGLLAATRSSGDRPLTIAARDEARAIGACLDSLLRRDRGRRGALRDPHRAARRARRLPRRHRRRSRPRAACRLRRERPAARSRRSAPVSRPGARFSLFGDADIAVAPDTIAALCEAMLDDARGSRSRSRQAPAAAAAPHDPLARALHVYNARRGFSTSALVLRQAVRDPRAGRSPDRTSSRARAATLPPIASTTTPRRCASTTSTSAARSSPRTARRDPRGRRRRVVSRARDPGAACTATTAACGASSSASTRCSPSSARTTAREPICSRPRRSRARGLRGLFQLALAGVSARVSRRALRGAIASACHPAIRGRRSRRPSELRSPASSRSRSGTLASAASCSRSGATTRVPERLADAVTSRFLRSTRSISPAVVRTPRSKPRSRHAAFAVRAPAIRSRPPGPVRR